MFRKIGLGQEVLITDPGPGADPKCDVQPGWCVTQSAKDYLNSINCTVPSARGYIVGYRGGTKGLRGFGNGLGKVCSLYTGNIVNKGMLTRGEFSLCGDVRSLPVCPPPVVTSPPVTKTDVPSDEEGDDDSMYMIGGILAVLVVGGVGYAVFKNRKKKGKKK